MIRRSFAIITDGFFKVMDRRTRALKPGARDFLGPSRPSLTS